MSIRYDLLGHTLFSSKLEKRPPDGIEHTMDEAELSKLGY